jgi:hypothetical protein
MSDIKDVDLNDFLEFEKQWEDFRIKNEIPYETFVASGHSCVEEFYVFSKNFFTETLKQENTKLKERLKEAENVVEDFILEKGHTKHCEIGMLNGDCCSCMDRKYYNQESCLERAVEYFRKYVYAIESYNEQN